MTENTKSVVSSIPHLITLSILLVVEYWIFMTHASSLLGSGDYGPLIGIPLVISLVVLIMIALGLFSISQNRNQHHRLVSISLVLFIVQMALIFLEYVVIASNMP